MIDVGYVVPCLVVLACVPHRLEHPRFPKLLLCIEFPLSVIRAPVAVGLCLYRFEHSSWILSCIEFLQSSVHPRIEFLLSSVHPFASSFFYLLSIIRAPAKLAGAHLEYHKCGEMMTFALGRRMSHIFSAPLPSWCAEHPYTSTANSSPQPARTRPTKDHRFSPSPSPEPSPLPVRFWPALSTQTSHQSTRPPLPFPCLPHPSS